MKRLVVWLLEKFRIIPKTRAEPMERKVPGCLGCREGHEHSEEVPDRHCPKCGFGYAWDGARCLHCEDFLKE